MRPKGLADESIFSMGSALPPPVLRDRSEDHLRDECGIFGIFGHEEAAKLTYLGLYAQQHRGQEGPAACQGRLYRGFAAEARHGPGARASYAAGANGRPR